jgi:ATP-dependent RNA helicase DDX46/PRP5
MQDFYVESPELARMSAAEVAAMRAELGGVTLHGKHVPRPVRNWSQCGLPFPIMQALKKAGYGEPLPVQAQALPIIMSGRDCIAVATTGSGKTLGFVLPMLRHVNDQVVKGFDEKEGNGPIGLVIAPTRELVQQVRCCCAANHYLLHLQGLVPKLLFAHVGCLIWVARCSLQLGKPMTYCIFGAASFSAAHR